MGVHRQYTTSRRKLAWTMLLLPTAEAPSKITLTLSTDSGLISIWLCAFSCESLLLVFPAVEASWRLSKKSRSNSVTDKHRAVENWVNVVYSLEV